MSFEINKSNAHGNKRVLEISNIEDQKDKRLKTSNEDEQQRLIQQFKTSVKECENSKTSLLKSLSATKNPSLFIQMVDSIWVPPETGMSLIKEIPVQSLKQSFIIEFNLFLCLLTNRTQELIEQLEESALNTEKEGFPFGLVRLLNLCHSKTEKYEKQLKIYCDNFIKNIKKNENLPLFVEDFSEIHPYTPLFIRRFSKPSFQKEHLSSLAQFHTNRFAKAQPNQDYSEIFRQENKQSLLLKFFAKATQEEKNDEIYLSYLLKSLCVGPRELIDEKILLLMINMLNNALKQRQEAAGYKKIILIFIRLCFFSNFSKKYQFDRVEYLKKLIFKLHEERFNSETFIRYIFTLYFFHIDSLPKEDDDFKKIKKIAASFYSKHTFASGPAVFFEKLFPIFLNPTKKKYKEELAVFLREKAEQNQELLLRAAILGDAVAVNMLTPLSPPIS